MGQPPVPTTPRNPPLFPPSPPPLPLSPVPSPKPFPLFGTLLLAALIALNGWLWIRTIPPGHAPDEVNHHRMVRFLVEHYRLPVLNQDIFLDKLAVVPDPYVTHPPGGYILSALVVELLPGVTDSVLSARLGSLVALLLALPWAVGLVRLLVPRSLACQLGIPAVCFFIPQVTFVGAYVNADAFGILAGTMLAFAATAILTRGWSIWRSVLLGVAVAFMLLGRMNGYAALPVCAIFVLFPLVRSVLTHRQQPLRAAGQLAIAFAVAALLAGPWFAFNHAHYHELLPVKTLAKAQAAINGGNPYLAPKDQGATHWTLLTRRDWIPSSFNSFFGVFDYMSVKMPRWTYRVLAGLTVLAALGLLARALRPRFADPPVPGARSAEVFLLLSSLATGALVLHIALTRDYQAQGRYFFPGLVGLGYLAVQGLSQLAPPGPPAPPSRRAAVSVLAAVAMAALNLFALTAVLTPQYPVLSPNSLLPDLERMQDSPSTKSVSVQTPQGRKVGFFVHSENHRTIRVLCRGKAIDMQLGLLPEARRQSDGVVFQITAWGPGEDANSPGHRLLDLPFGTTGQAHDQDWTPASADCSPWQGQEITLEFRVLPGATNRYDWAVFLDPRWKN